MNVKNIRAEWAPNVTRDLLAGTVVALALIPEAIAFSIIAGVDPKVGLYASFCIAVVTAIAGGRPAMISAATGSMALVMVTLVKEHGLGYLLAATILTGVLQIVASLLRLGDLMRFVSRSVVTGFVNALAILIFLAQLPELIGHGWQVYAMVAAGLAIIYLLPRATRAVPSPLVAIVVLTAFSIAVGLRLHTVGDMGQLPHDLPFFAIPLVPATLETLRIILPYALTLTMVGLLESLMTAAIVDEMTDTTSNKNRECAGQGLANIASGLFGGMAGCAMIGQSVINVSSGGRGRLSCLWAGAFLLFLIVVLGPWVRQIPMAALVAVMIMVSINTFQWRSIPGLLANPKSSSFVMLATVLVVVATHDLAKGVVAGVVLSGLFFAQKVARFFGVDSDLDEALGRRTYRVTGQIFFATAEAFHNAFDFREPLQSVVIDVGAAHFWDITGINALDRVVLKFRHHGVAVEIEGMNAASQTLVDRLALHDKPGATLSVGAH
ncbi:SulP family inorganic anion transporter [Acidisphaera rubrifaciens]|uniref:Transporter of sulfate n=1 Tax=Acidisphaera rubrifaciens HS-AP3 TaxID=1231350 RepID=A0A0D6P4B8_9PROT|nr:SulP family inorganic anion transporter [Acidisphaera rubrifaciens]GAN76171.1 transporter of sulfate [Acidisphaera rubrifaciens HS-AP3]